MCANTEGSAQRTAPTTAHHHQPPIFNSNWIKKGQHQKPAITFRVLQFGLARVGLICHTTGVSAPASAAGGGDEVISGSSDQSDECQFQYLQGRF
jgi:hypothetical protein